MLGVIGGSGLYQIEGLEDAQWVDVRSPFGAPSDQLLIGTLEGTRVCFLPRHGRGHRIPPDAVNYRANIDALKRAGVTDLLSLSAVGSLREELAPGMFVVADQLVDRTHRQERSFFGPGLVAHVSMADPVCARMGDLVMAAAQEAGLSIRRGGTWVVIDGPQFSTRAESALYRSWGCDVIGMTTLPEARLAREAELCFAPVAMVTDYDCWHPEHGAVSVSAVLEVMQRNGEGARALVRRLAAGLAGAAAGNDCPQGCRRALDAALATPPEARDPELLATLDAIAGRIIRGEGLA